MQTNKTIKSFLFYIIINLEKICAKYELFGKIYHNLFYRRMIKREIANANIKKNDVIMHIGCGSFPFTSLQLAIDGFDIIAVDIDENAVKNAKLVIQKWGLSDKIKVICANGLDMSVNEMDIVWIPFLVEPKREIIQKYWKQLKPNGRIICRNPHGLLKVLYNTTSFREFDGIHGKRINQLFEKESVIFTKD